jgi:hypothetical protein
MRPHSCISITAFSAALFLSNHDFSRGVANGKLSPIRRKEKVSIKERGLVIGGAVAASGDYPYFVHYATPGCGGSVRRERLGGLEKIKTLMTMILKLKFLFLPTVIAANSTRYCSDGWSCECLVEFVNTFAFVVLVLIISVHLRSPVPTRSIVRLWDPFCRTS